MNRLVVDSNGMSDPALSDWMKEPGNFAVINEANVIEAFKGDAARYFEIVRKQPHKVIVASSSENLSSLTSCSDDVSVDVINWELTQGFPAFCVDLDIHRFRPEVVYHLERAKRRVSEHYEDSRSRLAKMHDLLPLMMKEYSTKERNLIREEQKYSPELMVKIFRCALSAIRAAYDQHWYFKDHELPKGILHHFIFRLQLYNYVNLLRYIGRGNVAKDIEKLVNNNIDMRMGVYASYFEGIISNETTVREDVIKSTRMLNYFLENFEDDEVRNMVRKPLMEDT